MGLGWGGVGMVTFLALAHMVGATQVMGWGGVGVGWGGDDNVPCTCTHGRCYASHGIGGMITFLELAHRVGATQVMGWGGVGVGWGGDDNVPCTCTHGRCYATSCSLHLHTWSVLRKSWDGVGLGWGGVGMITFLELANMVDATQESIASITKSQLRRFGLSKVSRDGIEHRNVLAVHHINQRPGLATVLDALKKHRSLASRSFLSPSQVFKQPLWQV